jgi:hypothetical protein
MIANQQVTTLDSMHFAGNKRLRNRPDDRAEGATIAGEARPIYLMAKSQAGKTLGKGPNSPARCMT